MIRFGSLLRRFCRHSSTRDYSRQFRDVCALIYWIIVCETEIKSTCSYAISVIWTQTKKFMRNSAKKGYNWTKKIYSDRSLCFAVWIGNSTCYVIKVCFAVWIENNVCYTGTVSQKMKRNWQQINLNISLSCQWALLLLGYIVVYQASNVHVCVDNYGQHEVEDQYKEEDQIDNAVSLQLSTLT